MSKQLNVRLPERTGEQMQELIDCTGMTQVQLVIVAIDRLFQEERKTHKMTTKKLEQVLEQYLNSEDFKSGVIDSTKASWGGSSYKIELLPDGTWRNLWDNQIGNLYETSGAILPLPALNCGDMGEFTDNGGTEEEYLSLGFDNECGEIASELRDALRN